MEDEYITQQGIRYLLDWASEGFEIVGCAANGQEALGLMETLRPQIVLTDVVMPLMNGVDLTSALRARYPDVQVIVLSGYSDFEYVRDSFQGGAVDYILKPTLSPSLLLGTLQKAARRIPGLSLKSAEGAPEVCLGRMLSGFQSGDAGGPLRAALPLPGLLLVGENVSRAFGGDHTAAQRQAQRLSASLAQGLTGFPYLQLLTEENILLLALNFMPGQEDAALAAVRAVSADIALIEPRTFFVASRPFTRLEELHEVYHGAFLKDTERSFYYQGRHFLCPAELHPAAGAPKFDNMAFARYAAAGRFESALNLLCTYVDAAALAQEPEEAELKSVVQNAFYQVVTQLEGAGLDAGALASLKRECLTRLQASLWMTEFGQAVVDILSDLNAILEVYTAGGRGGVMQQVFSYIDVHYAEPITLQELARQFNFSYSYLSSCFHSHSTGGFSDYLNRERIRHAAALLQQGAPVSRACEAVGYGDQSYFTKVFKKYRGCTPSEYRHQNVRERK